MLDPLLSGESGSDFGSFGSGLSHDLRDIGFGLLGDIAGAIIMVSSFEW